MSDITFDRCLLLSPADSRAATDPHRSPRTLPIDKLRNPKSYARSHLHEVSSSRPQTYEASMDQATGSDTRTLPADPNRIAAWLKRRHPYHTAKLVALDTQADLRTVEGWLQARPPIWRHWQALCAAYGADFVCAVCLPDSDLQLRASVLREIEAAEARLTATLAKLREECA